MSFQGSKVNLRLLKGSRGFRVLKGFYDGLGDFSVAFVGLVVGCLWGFWYGAFIFRLLRRCDPELFVFPMVSVLNPQPYKP